MSESRKWRRRIALAWWRDRETAADEFEHHMHMRETELRAQGLSPADARAAAQVRFGDRTEAERYCEDQDAAHRRTARRDAVVDDLWRDTIHAARQLRRHPGLSLATIVTLATGIAVLLAAVATANAYLVRSLPYPDAARIVQITPGPAPGQFGRTPSLRDVDWRTVESVFDGTVAWDLDGFTLAGGEAPDYVDGAWVSPGFFTVLGLSPIRGRAFSPDEYAGDARVAMISHRLWQHRFGGRPDVVGSTIRIHSTDRPGELDLVTIVGVLPEGFWHVTRFTDVLRPLTTPRMPSLARLANGATIATAAARLNRIVRAQIGTSEPDWRMSLQTLQAEYAREARPVLLALVAGGVLMLVLASANVASMTVMRSATRRSEFVVRALLGAGAPRIARQILVEAAVPAISATVLAVGMASLVLNRAGAWMQAALGLPVPGGINALVVDARALLFALPITLLIAAFTGWRAYRAGTARESQTGLRAAGWQTRHDVRTRRVLMSAQVAMTFAMLVGAGLMARTVWELSHEPLGFDAAGVTKATLLLPQSRFPDEASRVRVTAALIDAFGAEPSVESVAAVGPHPFRGAAPAAAVVLAAGGDTSSIDVRPVVVTPDYFRLVRIELVRGRAFDSRDGHATERVVVVTESLARRIAPSGNALGARVRVGANEDSPARTVIGVVRDVRSSLRLVEQPELYIPAAQAPRAYTSFVFRSRTGNSTSADALRRAAASVDGWLALTEIEPLADVVRRESSRQRFLATLLAAFATSALLLSALGLAAALGFAVVQRRREIALRLAVGGTPRQIVGLVVHEVTLTTMAGIAAGAVTSALLARVLTSQLYGVDANDPVVLGAIAGLVALVAAIAATLPAYRAASVDPAHTLRV